LSSVEAVPVPVWSKPDCGINNELATENTDKAGRIQISERV
jgi:hypothetical protein